MVTRRAASHVVRWAAAAMLAIVSVPAQAGADRSAGAVPDAVAAALSHRLFPLLGSGIVAADRRDLASMLAARTARRTACAADAPCLARAMLWTDTESAALIVAAGRGTAPSVPELPDDGLAAGLAREFAGLNTIIQVYALGEAPGYPAIDGPGIPADDAEARLRVRVALAIAQTPRRASLQSMDPSIEFALALLDVNDRTDAIGFEPLTGGLNAAATARAQSMDWVRYRYSAMVVPGAGPEVPDMPLSTAGKLRVRMAADRFARGDVPFIILSGGRTHPRATPFVEAVEMRRALIERHGVPADAILIEPYARHTTTNLRNATRLLMAMRAPLGRDALIVTDPEQSRYIESETFAARNRKELGYEPGSIGRRLTPNELEFRPSARSARIDPHDPLDP
jgi:hypothetical protein